MGSTNLRPTKIQFGVSDENQDLFERANILRIVREETKEQFYARLIQDALNDPNYTAILGDKNWVRWHDLVDLMKKAGFSINRTTFWQYRQRTEFGQYIRTDGTDVLYDADGIEAYFKQP